MDFSHLAADVSRAQGGAGVGGDFAGGGRGSGGGGEAGEGARGGVGGGGGGGGGGKSDGCVVDPGSRSNARSVVPGHQSLQESLLAGKGLGSRPFQGSPGTFEGQSGPLEGPPGTLVRKNDTLEGSYKVLDSQEEEFEKVEVAMADLTLSRTPHSLKKVINND